MTCYTFSVSKVISESENMRTAMKNCNEKENEDFSQGHYFNFDDLILSEFEIILDNFWLR